MQLPKKVAFQMSIVLVLAVAPFLASAQESLSTFCGECRAEKVATCGGFLEGASLDPSGGLWVVDVTGGRVLNITHDGKCVVKGNTGGLPNGSKFTKDGRLIITDAKLGLITMDLSTSKVSVIADTYEGSSLATANDLAIDAAGGIYFTVSGVGSGILNPNGRVFYLEPDGKTLHLFADKIAFSNGIALSNGGRTVLIAEFAAQRVLSAPALAAKGRSSPGLSSTFVYARTRGGIGPDGILVDAKGHLLTANLGTGEVLVFTPDGRLMGGIQLPDEAGKGVTNFVISGHDLYITDGGAVWKVVLSN
jgi:gluconolactonase